MRARLFLCLSIVLVVSAAYAPGQERRAERARPSKPQTTRPAQWNVTGRGVVVGGLPSKERRDFLASEARQRAARQRLAPFAVLVLEGSVRRPIASPVMSVLEALEGQDVAILVDNWREPPMNDAQY